MINFLWFIWIWLSSAITIMFLLEKLDELIVGKPSTNVVHKYLLEQANERIKELESDLDRRDTGP